MATTAEPTAQQLPTLIHLAALTHLEGQIRAAKTIQELQFLSVNETRRLIPYEQAFLLSASRLRERGVSCAQRVKCGRRGS